MNEQSDFFLEERRQAIVRRVNETKRISVGELSKEFGVSPVTIRNDLNVLAQKKLITRTHGGAVPFTHLTNEVSLAYRRERQTAAKEQIGAAAAQMVKDGDAIFLDSSTTTMAIARHLKDRKGLTVITNCLVIADEFLDVPNVNVVMPGGQLRRETASLVGDQGLEILKSYNIVRGFFGAHGITLEEGLTDISPDEAKIKSEIVCMCREVIAVFDATKWGKIGVASFASIDQIQKVISNNPQDISNSTIVNDICQKGIEVLFVDSK